MLEIPEKIVDVRPWGQFIQYTHNQPTTVKILQVNPGHRLSIQRHKNRDELWIALDSWLLATVDDKTRSLHLGDEVWIPKGTSHTLENRGHAQGRVLEIAFGYFDENDIERLEDNYGRC